MAFLSFPSPASCKVGNAQLLTCSVLPQYISYWTKQFSHNNQGLTHSHQECNSYAVLFIGRYQPAAWTSSDHLTTSFSLISCLFSSDFPSYMRFSHLTCVCCICHEFHPSWFIIHLTDGKECKFLLCTFYHSHVTSSPLRPNTLLITLFKHIHLMPFLDRGFILTTDIIVILYTLMFMLLVWRQENKIFHTEWWHAHNFVNNV